MEASDATPTRSPYHENRAPETSGSESSRDKTPSQNTTETMTNIAKKRRLDEAGEAQVILGLTEAFDDSTARIVATEPDAIFGYTKAPSNSSPMRFSAHHRRRSTICEHGRIRGSQCHNQEALTQVSLTNRRSKTSSMEGLNSVI